MEVFEGEDHNHHSSSSATSSIGKDSDALSETQCAHNDSEAQSAYKCNEPLDSMDSLQHLLPIRRGISKFYDGKSKSFTSLVDSSPSVKDMSKPENAYSKRRRNLMAFNHTWRKSQNYPLRSKCGGFSKRTIKYDSNSSCASEDSSSSSNPRSPPLLPPIHPTAPPSTPMHHKFSTWHFLSLADIPGK